LFFFLFITFLLFRGLSHENASWINLPVALYLWMSLSPIAAKDLELRLAATFSAQVAYVFALK